MSCSVSSGGRECCHDHTACCGRSPWHLSSSWARLSCSRARMVRGQRIRASTPPRRPSCAGRSTMRVLPSSSLMQRVQTTWAATAIPGTRRRTSTASQQAQCCSATITVRCPGREAPLRRSSPASFQTHTALSTISQSQPNQTSRSPPLSREPATGLPCSAPICMPRPTCTSAHTSRNPTAGTLGSPRDQASPLRSCSSNSRTGSAPM